MSTCTRISPTTIGLTIACHWIAALALCGPAAATEAQVRGFRHGQSLTYFVQARRPTDAAEVVNTLADDGFAPVFMVVR
jgi:hypothetical protein